MDSVFVRATHLVWRGVLASSKAVVTYDTEAYFYEHRNACPLALVDKPGRRVGRQIPWGKAAAVVIVGILVTGGGWEIYWNYVYKSPPIYARVDTSDGTFYMELFPACAPQTVANFVNLTNSGFYNGLVWHRIVDTPTPFVIQTGDPNTKGGLNSTRTTWGQGTSGRTVPLEWCGWLHNYEGYVGMAHLASDVNSGTSQFYINLSNSSANLSLDGNFTVFAKVISGWSTVEALAKSPICQPPTCPSSWQANEPLPPVFVDDIVILTSQQATTEISSLTSA
jgi:cyclophilin family peptidyl-prolyl cis-trans isomerase